MKKAMMCGLVMSVMLMIANAEAAFSITTADGVGADTYLSTTDTYGRIRSDGGWGGSTSVRYAADSRLQFTAYRFDLTGLAADDFTDVRLQFNISWVSNANRYFDVYGLVDSAAPADDAGGSFTNGSATVWNDYWKESGYTDGLMWATAGKVGISAGATVSEFVLDSRWTHLGTTHIAGARDSVTGMTSTSVADVPLDSFLQNDMNGYVTLLVTSSQWGGGAWFNIVTKEGAAGDASLTPTLTNVPEPATMAMLCLGTLLAVRRRR